MATYESNLRHLAEIWRSQDDIIMHISNQMVQIWEDDTGCKILSIERM